MKRSEKITPVAAVVTAFPGLLPALEANCALNTE
jgi:hypothetical protein